MECILIIICMEQDIMQNNGEFYMPRCQNASYNNTLFYYDNVENIIECIAIFSTLLQGDLKTDSPPKKSKKKKSDELQRYLTWKQLNKMFSRYVHIQY